MAFQKLSSSHIDGIDYNTETSVLTVVFTSGGRYSYRGVPPDVAEDFADAPSPGSFFHDNIKDVYPYQRA